MRDRGSHRCDENGRRVCKPAKEDKCADGEGGMSASDVAQSALAGQRHHTAGMVMGRVAGRCCVQAAPARLCQAVGRCWQED